MKRVTIVSTVVAAMLTVPATSHAARNCGNLTFGGQSQWITSGDLTTCPTARRMLVRYWRQGITPTNWKCGRAYGAPDCWHRTSRDRFAVTTAPH